MYAKTFKNQTELILASASPRRQELLSLLGIHFFVQPSTISEPEPAPNQSPQTYALNLSQQKAADVAQKFPQDAVLGADTIVVFNDKILGKPRDHKQALDYLLLLTGKTHTVITAVTLIVKGQTYSFAVQTQVNMANFPLEILKKYAASSEPLDKAGAYAIQGEGSFLIKSISGSYTNVIGLPLTETTNLLLEKKVIV